MSWKLADLFVSFSVKGMESLLKGFGDVEGSLNKLNTAANAVGGTVASKMKIAGDVVRRDFAERMAPAVEKAADRLVTFAARTRGLSDAQTQNLRVLVDKAARLDVLHGKLSALTTTVQTYASAWAHAVGIGTAVVGGFVTAGISMSALGDILKFRFEQLSLTIAGMFRPEIEAVSNAIAGLTDWLNNLSDAQLESIAFWAKLTVASLAFALIIPKLVAAIAWLVAALRSLTIAQIVALAFAGPKGWAQIAVGLGIAAAGIGAAALLLSASMPDLEGGGEGGKGGAGGGSSRRRLMGRVGGKESPEATWDRIAQASIRATAGGKPVDEQQLDELRNIRMEQQKTNQELGRMKPAIAK